MEETVTEFYRTEDGLVYVLDCGKLTAKLIQSPKATGDVIIPATLNYKNQDYKIVTIGEAALSNNKAIKSIKFGQDSPLNAIEKQAFASSSIESISFPVNLTRIGEGAFGNCDNLQKVEFPNGSKLIAVGKDAFPPALLAKITLPNDVKENGIVENLF